MAVLDLEQVSRDLIRALRGRRSQPALSRQLGFRSNVFYSWEHGRRYPEVSLFFRVAGREKPELAGELAQFFHLPEAVFGGRKLSSPRTVTTLVQQLVGSTPKTRLATLLDVDRTTLGRWCTGKTEPRLPEFLSLLQASTQRLLPFVGLFADASRLPSTAELFVHLQRQRRLAYELPMSHAVLRALELSGYQALERHDSAYIADQLGISAGQVDRLLQDLVAAGQATREGEHYTTARILTVDTREDPEQNHRLKEFWAREALGRFADKSAAEGTLFSFNLFAISEQSYQQIRELHLAHYDRVRSIIEQSPTADRVVLMNLQLVPLQSAQ